MSLPIRGARCTLYINQYPTKMESAIAYQLSMQLFNYFTYSVGPLYFAHQLIPYEDRIFFFLSTINALLQLVYLFGEPVVL